MKPGIKTTEFWLALVVVTLGALAATFSEAQWAQAVGLVAAALTSAGYGMSRAKAKTF